MAFPSVRRLRAPGALYTGLSIALVVILAAVSLTSRQPPPPTVAEVAPNSTKAGPDGARSLAGAENTSDQQAQPSPLSEPNRPVTDTDAGPLAGSGRPGGTTADGGTGAGSSGGGGTGDTGGSLAGGTGGGGPAGGTDSGDGPTGDTGSGDGSTAEPPSPGATTTTTPGQPPGPGTATSTTLPGATTTVPPGGTTTTSPPGTTTTVPPGSTTTTPGPGTTTTTAPGTTTTTAPSTTTTTTPPVGITRNCVGSPPRQTEDPQSPPCRQNSPFDATNNGGTTYTGVTADEIKVAVFRQSGGANPPDQPQFALLEQFFNKRYEFYGRKLKLVPKAGSGVADFGSTTDAQTKQINKANEVADEGFFAATTMGQLPDETFYDQLANRGVISVSSQEPIEGEPQRPEHENLKWKTLPGLDVMGRSMGEWICRQFPVGPGVKANFAGPAEVLKDRKLGVITSSYLALDAKARKDDLQQGLKEGCGREDDLDPPRSFEQVYDGNINPDVINRARTALSTMQSDGVTTVACLCKVASLRAALMPAAESLGFEPEWLVSSWGQNDFDKYSYASSTPPATQLGHMMGISYHNQWVPQFDLPVEWAVTEIDPLHVWLPQSRANFNGPYEWQAWYYPALQMLAAGIQMAGPNLNPQTFHDGLMSTVFPNPNSTDPFQARARAGRVGLNGDHTMIDDASIVYWNPAALSNWDGTAGTWCYAEGGRRFSLGTWNQASPTLLRGRECRPVPPP